VTYGLAALRRVLYPATAPVVAGLPSLGLSLVVTLAFCLLTFGGALTLARRTTRSARA